MNALIDYLTALYSADPQLAAAVVAIYAAVAILAAVVVVVAIRRSIRRRRRGRVEFYSVAAGSGYTGRRLSSADCPNHDRRRRYDGRR
jgi:hypothetical protein